MAWEPIIGLGENRDRLASQELSSLVEVWNEQRDSLSETEGLKEFNERLAREWAIETGILERLYTLDRGVTQLLIERGINEALISSEDTDQPPELVAALINDQKEAVDWLFDLIKSECPFSEWFIKELHSLITRSQPTVEGIDSQGHKREIPLLRGKYKVWPNNPTRPDGCVHEYCPPEQVTVEMERLVKLHDRYRDEKVAPDVLSAWLHHRFTQIHPFQDGNGRVARGLASLVFIREGWFPLVIHRDQHNRYIEACESADRGDLAPLVDLFAAAQRKAFVNALGTARDVPRASEHLDHMVAAIGDHFRKRDKDLARNMVEAKNHATTLWKSAGRTFADASARLKEAIGASPHRNAFDDGCAPDDKTGRRHRHRWQIIEAAKELDYFANTAEFAAWRRLGLETENGRSEIFLSFHAVGREYRGIVGASLSFYRKPETDEGHSRIEDRYTVSKELFQINYLESLEAVQARFDAWLDKHLLAALDLWRRGE